MKNNKNNKVASILSLIASICFFITYSMTKENINIIFSIVWICIGIAYLEEYKKKKR